jgi:hypothetical protein
MGHLMNRQFAPTAPAGVLFLLIILVVWLAIHWWFKVGVSGMPGT